MQETGEKAKGFFSGLRDNLKSSFNSKEAQKVLDEASAPIDTTQVQQPVAPQVQQPTAPQVQQPTAPQTQQPTAPQVQQPATPEVQPGDVQQPTNVA